MKLLSGIKARQNYIKKLKKEVRLLKPTPVLATILNNDSYASKVYIRNKTKLCHELGIKTKLYKMSGNTTNKQMVSLIQKLNKDKHINGLFVQLPTSKQIDNDLIVNTINPLKDVDCFNNVNVGKLWTAKEKNNDLLKPCTAVGIIELLKYYKIKLDGKNVVIVNRSNIVGKPLAALFLLENATVTCCHDHTKNLKSITKKADIVVVAIGKAKFFDQSYFKNNAIIIDVGINRDPHTNKVCGDIKIESFKNFKGAISPVPGGVGAMTTTMLVNNLIKLTKIQRRK